MGIENKPYVGFPITPHCCFECLYCKDGGESGREAELLSENFVVETASMAYDLGTRKFRLTGGEPFMHPELGDILYRLSEFNGVDITVNTTGIPLIDRQGILSSTPPNVSFVVSLDSLNESTFNIVRQSSVPAVFARVMSSIKDLSHRGVLKRLNMVVTKENSDEVFRIIDFCRSLGCDLKISDVASNSGSYKDHETIFTPIDRIEAKLEEASRLISLHEYSQAFGIPCKIYDINGVKVTVKNSKNGARYNLEAQCGSCENFPCHEGLYFISAQSSGSFSGCRLDIVNLDGENRQQALSEIMDIIMAAEPLQSLR